MRIAEESRRILAASFVWRGLALDTRACSRLPPKPVSKFVAPVHPANFQTFAGGLTLHIVILGIRKTNASARLHILCVDGVLDDFDRQEVVARLDDRSGQQRDHLRHWYANRSIRIRPSQPILHGALRQ